MIVNIPFIFVSCLSFFFFHSIVVKATDTQLLKCGPNEVLNSCPKYGTSDDDCDAIFGGFKKACPPQPADYQPTPRCDCKEGFVRNADKMCIPLGQCCSGQNEEMTNCPSPCDDTCLGKPHPGCTLIPCFKKGCRCKPDFVRHNNTCISRKDCPPTVELPRIYKPLEAIGGKNKTAKILRKPGARANICVAKNAPGKNGTQIAKVKRPGKILKPEELPPMPKPTDPVNSTPLIKNSKSPSPPIKPLNPVNTPPAANNPPLKPLTPGNSPPSDAKPLSPIKTTTPATSPPNNKSPLKPCPK